MTEPRKLELIEWIMMPKGIGKTTTSKTTPVFADDIRTLVTFVKGQEPPEPLFVKGEIVEIDGARYEILGWEAFVMHIHTQRGPMSLSVRPVGNIIDQTRQQ